MVASWAGSSRHLVSAEAVEVAEMRPSAVGLHAEAAAVGAGRERRRRRLSLSVMRGHTKRWKSLASFVGAAAEAVREVADWMAGAAEAGVTVVRTVSLQETKLRQSGPVQTHTSHCAGRRVASGEWKGWLEAWRPPLPRLEVHRPSWAAPGDFPPIASAAA